MKEQALYNSIGKSYDAWKQHVLTSLINDVRRM